MDYKEVDSAGMWSRVDKNNKPFFSVVAEINGEKYSFPLFANEYKEKDNHPDYKFSPKKEKENVQGDTDVTF